jgi:hypothetical protein
MEEFKPLIREVYFKFGDDEPIKFAHTTGDEFSLTLKDGAEEPTVVFSDGKGNLFTMFIKKRDELQS